MKNKKKGNEEKIENNLDWVVQRWVELKPGLSKKYGSNCFSDEKVKALIKYCSDFSRIKIC